MAKKKMKKQQKNQKVVKDDETVFLSRLLIALVAFLISYIGTTYLTYTTDFENVIFMLADKLH